MTSFQAVVVSKTETSVSTDLQTVNLSELGAGDVTIRVAYSSVNYKDGLAAHSEGRVARIYPLIPGIDLAGIVVSSTASAFREGDAVIVTGYGLGVSHHGGLSEYARVPAEWVVPLPSGLSAKEAMIVGTAGFTAALSVIRLEEQGLRPDQGPVVVTGATGGVGSHAVSMLANLGYEVVASTGKHHESEYLRALGAIDIVPRFEAPDGPLGKATWAGAIDPVGGPSLAHLLATTKYGGSVAVSGLTGGGKVPTTVFPFILRGVNLLGIDSVECPMDVRRLVWDRIASELVSADQLSAMATEIPLSDAPTALSDMLSGSIRGRVVVRVTSSSWCQNHDFTIPAS